jgi:hypothetical protein
MENSDAQYAVQTLRQLQTEYLVTVEMDWGEASDGTWQKGNWTRDELDRLHTSISLMAGVMGGSGKFVENLQSVTVKKADIGSHGGEALTHKVMLSATRSFSAWTVVHEFAHAWDANQGWKLSRLLEKYTGGFTNPFFGFLKRLVGASDSGLFAEENKPGGHGRMPGCNAAGYFYSDKPSGSNWKFNRLEDFAESIAMYIGWKRSNSLSDWAEARIRRYTLENGARDKTFGVDNWTDYARYFYPDGGDYTKTLRWKFVEELVKGRLNPLFR